MKAKKITALLLLSLIIGLTSACTPNTPSEQASSENSVQTSEISQNGIEPVADEQQETAVKYNFGIEYNQIIRNLPTVENNLIYLPVNEYEGEISRNNPNFKSYIFIYESDGTEPTFKEKIELSDIENDGYINDCRVFDNGTKMFYSTVRYDENYNLSDAHSYIAEIKDYKIENVRELTVDNIVSGVSMVEDSIGSDKAEDILLTGTVGASKGNKLLNYFVFKSGDKQVALYGFVDGDSLEIELVDSSIIQSVEHEAIGEGKTSAVRPYFDENGNVVLVSLYEDENAELRMAFNTFDIEDKKIVSSTSSVVQNTMFTEEKADCTADDVLAMYIGNDNETLYYMMSDQDKVYEIFGVSLESLKNGDKESSSAQTAEYVENEFDKYDTSSFEMTYRNKSSDIKDKSGVYYEIFVRSFADSDGNGIGDFNGITEKLDYLKDLGIDGIWLMPINKSSSYHGYDIDDYYTLNSDYGTEQDFQNLIDKAHEKGIKVIMDMVINHTGYNNEWFQQALSDSESKYKNYYRWTVKEDKKDYSNIQNLYGSSVWNKVGSKYYYATFGKQMPDLNYNNPEVREEIKNVAKKYLEMGIDGFRLDAAIHIYANGEFRQMADRETANLQWWNEFSAYCETVNPDVYIVGEAWEENNIFAEYSKPFDSKFDFAFQSELINAVNAERAETSDGTNLSEYFGSILSEYAKYDDKFIDAVFAANHDQDRLLTQTKTEEKAKLTAAVYMTLLCNPFIYYGEEIGMQGSGDDELTPKS